MPRDEKDVRMSLFDRWKELDFQFLKLDELDLRILDKLSEDSRRDNVDVAKDLKVGESTIRRRVRHMKKVGLIAGYSVDINYDILENPVKAYVTIRADGAHRPKIIRSMCQHPRSIAVYRTAGDDGILCVMLFRSADEYQDFADSHPVIEGARGVSMQVVLSSYKGRVWSGA